MVFPKPLHDFSGFQEGAIEHRNKTRFRLSSDLIRFSLKATFILICMPIFSKNIIEWFRSPHDLNHLWDGGFTY